MHLVTFVTCAGAALAFVRCAADTGLWCDELLFQRAIRAGAWDGLRLAGSSHPPLARWIVAALVPDGASDLVWRVPSIAFSVLAVFVWSRVLARWFDDRVTAALLLPAMALNPSWTNVAYQLSPYPLLVLLASLHAWSWCRVAEGRRHARTMLALSAALAAWTHFFGLGLVVADAFVVGGLVLARRMELARARAWLLPIGAAAVLALPVLPILAFYIEVDRPFALVEVRDRLDYALWAARNLFKASVTQRVDVAPFAWVALWLALGALAWRALRARADRERDGAVSALASSLPGVPAAQAFAFVSGRAVFERYALAGAWAHPAAIVLAISLAGPRAFGRALGRLAAAALLALALVRAVTSERVHALETHDWSPVVAHLRANARPGDVFGVPQIDLWTGDAAFDALWNARYGEKILPNALLEPQRRAQLLEHGLALDPLPANVERVWIFSHLFTEKDLRRTPLPRASHFELRELSTFGSAPPLALFERVR